MMINASLFALNILLLALVWKFMLRPTLLDHFRDRLFDLRESVRTDFVQRGLPLTDPAYCQIRNLLNGYIRYIEQLSVWHFSAMVTFFQLNPEAATSIKEAHRAAFSNCSPKVREKLDLVRRRAFESVCSYIVFTSLPFTLLTFAIALVYLPVTFARQTIHAVRRQRGFILNPKVLAAAIPAAFAAVMMTLPMKVLPFRVFNQSLTEERVCRAERDDVNARPCL